MVKKIDTHCTLFFGGDICISAPIQEDFIEENLKKIIVSHDLRIANWEAPIIKPSFNTTPKAGPSIHQHESYSYFLSKNLFTAYSLANNHIFDYGKEGFDNTTNILKKYSKFVGASTKSNKEIYKPLCIEKNNIKIAFIACGENQFGTAKEEIQNEGYAWIFSNQIVREIQNLKKEVDFIIILAHAGLEMEDLPLPEWRACYQNLIDLGADMVIASHPHVIQPKEIYQGKPIYYSLGNLLFNTANLDEKWNISLGVSCELSIIQGTKNIEIKEYFIEWNQKQLQLLKTNNYQKHFENLNNIINHTKEYYKQIDEICAKVWKNYYESYYLFKKDVVKYSIKQNIFVKLFFKKTKSSSFLSSKSKIMLYHNIAIETHRFVVERIIKKIENLH